MATTGGVQHRPVAPPTGAAAAARVAPTLVVVGLLVLVANRWGQHLLDDGVRLRILAPPIIGRFRFGPPGGLAALLLPAATGAVLVRLLPRLAARQTWSRVLLVGFVGAVAWATALALVDGVAGLTRPMELTGHYLLDVGQVGSPGDFLRHFTERIDLYGTHVRSHPPGLVLLLWAMAQVGLGGSGGAAALVIAGGAAAVPAVLTIVREVAGEAMARRALPLAVLAPASLYVASTGDALFAGVGLWAIALVVRATGTQGRARRRLALAGGATFAVALLLSYGVVLLGLVPLAVLVARRDLRTGLLAAAAGAAVLGGTALAGFWWLDGLQTTRREYAESVASVRPYGYFLLANLAALAVIVGPATVAGLGRWLRGPARERALGLLLAPALAIVAVANVSGLSKGEVERIWLPFALLLLPAGALVAEPGDAGGMRRWLWVQVAVAVAVTGVVRTHW